MNPQVLTLRHLLTCTALWLILQAGFGCAMLGSEKGEPEIRHWPGGVVTRVEFAEKFLIFEGSHTFPPGQELRVMRNGRPVGTVQVRADRIKRFHSADILEGTAQEGDVVEAPLPAQAEEGDEG